MRAMWIVLVFAACGAHAQTTEERAAADVENRAVADIVDCMVTGLPEDWRQATQEAVDAADQLVHDVEEARTGIEKSAGTIDTSFDSLSNFDGILNKVIQDVQDAALAAGLDWIL